MSVNTFHEIGAALDGHLRSLPGIPVDGARVLIHWENTQFEKPDGKPWLQTKFMPAGSEGRSLGGNPITRAQGIYHINVFVPSGSGPKAADHLADSIMRHFKSGIRPSHQSTTVTLRTPSRGSGITETDWYQIPVMVRWYSHTTEL
ncbi:MAG: hypothetical protein DRJ65_00090 [Acidobacteria bacterium]|nr:MAG: hypothetical protein DRJ65_00090 [Acidobacteriota bacterium]